MFVHACVFLCSFMRVYMRKDRQVSGGSKKSRLFEEVGGGSVRGVLGFG